MGSLFLNHNDRLSLTLAPLNELQGCNGAMTFKKTWLLGEIVLVFCHLACKVGDGEIAIFMGGELIS